MCSAKFFNRTLTRIGCSLSSPIFTLYLLSFLLTKQVMNNSFEQRTSGPYWCFKNKDLLSPNVVVSSWTCLIQHASLVDIVQETILRWIFFCEQMVYAFRALNILDVSGMQNSWRIETLWRHVLMALCEFGRHIRIGLLNHWNLKHMPLNFLSTRIPGMLKHLL